jgi:hypothetical protein
MTCVFFLVVGFFIDNWVFLAIIGKFGLLGNVSSQRVASDLLV